MKDLAKKAIEHLQNGIFTQVIEICRNMQDSEQIEESLQALDRYECLQKECIAQKRFQTDSEVSRSDFELYGIDSENVRPNEKGAVFKILTFLTEKVR